MHNNLACSYINKIIICTEMLRKLSLAILLNNNSKIKICSEENKIRLKYNVFVDISPQSHHNFFTLPKYFHLIKSSTVFFCTRNMFRSTNSHVCSCSVKGTFSTDNTRTFSFHSYELVLVDFHDATNKKLNFMRCFL